MTAIRTARDRARAELTQEIKNEARRQLAEVGAHGLSLRAVARELGMVSSALYRYFPSRDNLLTALIVDAYNAIGEAVEKADDQAEQPRVRWQSIWQAARGWAREHPHEYALIYGSPIPGYQAPQDTVGPAARVALALIDVAAGGALRPAYPGPEVSGPLREQALGLAGTLEKALSAAEVGRLMIAWTQLFGAISFELFGQYVGSADPADAFFSYTCLQMADFVGLT
ncbi:TetR/AcrR family transcriptional regulator [Amycolatopsis alkalitolerans]|uniref:TetR/AcrR family transcriptional regulator n=1 Tax=Amycolatopsis alkalitolerans TaxID=2547244 RepID=A0A5C4M9B7_9PSEU|nr:TetR/AcrR family transcriptional regulator [Amycolatopsis alkalitolerans]TNC28509.1 TetR/AcrR family transcriptional regulator [Amycolatopsis alkalitolerans]